MADFSPPNQFSNVAHKWVHEQKRDSILFVRMVRRPQFHQHIVHHLTENFNMTIAEANETIATPFYATGFIFHRVGNLAFVLTCCHLLEEFYSQDNLPTEECASWFRFFVLCKQNEAHMELNYPDLYNLDHDPRNYTPAHVVKVDQSKDLLLLQFDMTHLYGDMFPNQCQHPHPPLGFAQHRPDPVTDVVMISWPPHRCDTVVIGQVVTHRRSYGQMTNDHSKGYSMEQVELKITGEKGTSGSPVLDHRGDVVALYHGRVNGKGYAVSLAEIIDFLNDD